VAVFSSDPVIALGVVDAMAMAIPIPHRQLFIDGEWSEPLRGKRLPIINPATEESIGRSTVEDVELAVAAARKALTRNKGKDWARAPGAVRAKYLRAIAAKLFIRTCLELAQVCKEVALPPGVLNVVTGLGPEAGAPLASHPHVDKVQLDLHLIDLVMQVAFTGSTETGKKIMTSAAQMVKVCLFCEQDEREVWYSPRVEEAQSGAPTRKRSHKERLIMVKTRLDVLEASLEELHQGQRRLLGVESS
ncbi:hypothetical protein BHE74_00004389, partial [Ensete ventricosum]